MKRRYRAIGPPNAEQQAHQDKQRANGCAACHLWGVTRACGPNRVHHQTIGDCHGQKQRGQDFTIGLGDYHHQGIPLPGISDDAMRKEFGPSLQLHKREFLNWIQDRLGERSTDALRKYQDDLIEQGAT